MRILYISITLLLAFLFSNCSVNGVGPATPPSMAGPSREARASKIASEPKGGHFIGRRYYVEKTRFWGYVRKPGQPWSAAKLVMLNEDRKLAPDRFPEEGPPTRRYAFDANYEYKLYGRYTGQKAYDPNSNQFLPEFQLTGYELLDESPGWIFSPGDAYDAKRITLFP